MSDDPQHFTKEQQEAVEPDAYCDSCDSPMWEENGDNCSSFWAYGLETVACQRCRS